MENFEELYKESIKNDTKLDRIVTGKIINITSKGEIYVDLNYKADGIIPRSEYSFDINDNPADEFNIGDEITAEVVKMNDGVGNVLLSFKRLKEKEQRAKLEEKVKHGEIFETKISQANEKGLTTEIDGIRVFIPMSLSEIKRDENIENYIGKSIQYKIIEFMPGSRKVIGSKKIISDEKKEKEENEFWNQVQIGQEYQGVIVSINSYGVFVDIGPVQGLLHVSDITWRRNVDINKYFKIGQVIQTTIKEIDKQNRKIKLAYPDKEPNPWNSVEDKYHKNDIIKVTIKKFMPFGAFAELEDGVEGLIHISQISDERITKPEDKLELSQKVDAKIIGIDIENKKIELSIKDVNTLNLEDELKGVEGITFNLSSNE